MKVKNDKELFINMFELLLNGDIDKLLINVHLAAEEYYTIISKYITNDTFDEIEYNGVDWDYYYEIETSDEKKYFISGSSKWGYIEITKMLPVPMENFMAAYDDGLDISHIHLDVLKYAEKAFQESGIKVTQFEVEKIIDDSDVEDSASFIQTMINKIQDSLEVFIAMILNPATINKTIIESTKHYVDLGDERLRVRFSEKFQERKAGGTMRVIVAGGRDFIDSEMMDSEIVCFLEKNNVDNNIVEIVSGMAKGADKLGIEFARKYGYKVKEMPADWNKGKAAGYLRNEEMAKYASEKPNGVLIAFWDGYSKGTKHMIDIAAKNHLKVHVVNYEVEKQSIDWLKGQYAFLSMFFVSEQPIIYKSNTYKCGEAAYQAQKIESHGNDSATLQKSFCSLVGYEAKAKGKLVPLRKDWEEVKYGILEEIVYAKFSRDEKLKNLLLSTGDLNITECNFWHDNEYGDCKCKSCRDIEGKNMLGKILMKVRDIIKQEDM